MYLYSRPKTLHSLIPHQSRLTKTLIPKLSQAAPLIPSPKRFATATTQSESDSDVVTGSDSESECKHCHHGSGALQDRHQRASGTLRHSRRISQSRTEDTVTSDGEEEITLQTSRKYLKKINALPRAQSQKKDDEIANHQAQSEPTNGHAVILRHQCAPLIARIYEKKRLCVIGVIELYARNIQSYEA